MSTTVQDNLAVVRVDPGEPSPPRVLQLLDTAQFAGTERLVLSLTAALARAGTPVCLGCRGESPLYRAAVEQGLDVVPLYTRGLFSNGSVTAEPRLPQVRSVVKEMRSRSIDIVHGHNGRTTLAAAVAARVTGRAAVASQHFVRPASADYGGVKRVLATAAHGWVNRQLGAVVAVSSAARTEMIRRVGFPPDRIVHIPNGIDPPAAPDPAKIAAIRDELIVAAGVPLVVTVARLADEKGLETWVDGVALIHKIRPDARFVVVGEGPRRGPLTTQIARLGLDGVLTLAGFRPDATDWIAAGDLFVLPSPAEPFGLVIPRGDGPGETGRRLRRGRPAGHLDRRRGTGCWSNPGAHRRWPTGWSRCLMTTAGPGDWPPPAASHFTTGSPPI